MLLDSGAARFWCCSCLALLRFGAARIWRCSYLALLVSGAARPLSCSALALLGPCTARPLRCSALALLGSGAVSALALLCSGCSASVCAQTADSLLRQSVSSASYLLDYPSPLLTVYSAACLLWCLSALAHVLYRPWNVSASTVLERPAKHSEVALLPAVLGECRMVHSTTTQTGSKVSLLFTPSCVVLVRQSHTFSDSFA